MTAVSYYLCSFLQNKDAFASTGVKRLLEVSFLGLTMKPEKEGSRFRQYSLEESMKMLVV